MYIYRTLLCAILVGGTFVAACATRAQVPPPEQQIAVAVQAAPEAMRDEAAVLGYDAAGELVTLREGRNELICLADRPEDDRFHVACYHAALEPFMERGRALRAQGFPDAEVDSIRQAEIEAGELEMPDHPASLYSLTGASEVVDAETGDVADASPLYVLYTPFATGEELGLPERPVGSKPWLMDAGKPWAHVMVTSVAGEN